MKRELLDLEPGVPQLVGDPEHLWPVGGGLLGDDNVNRGGVAENAGEAAQHPVRAAQDLGAEMRSRFG